MMDKDKLFYVALACSMSFALGALLMTVVQNLGGM